MKHGMKHKPSMARNRYLRKRRAYHYTVRMNSIRTDIPLDNNLDLQKHLIKHPAATFFMRVKGKSLVAEGVFDNDLLIVDRALTPKIGSLIVAVIDGSLVLRRFSKNAIDQHGGEIWGVVTYAIHDVRVN